MGLGLDLGVVGDRPVPHLLVTLLTPTRTPHARLPKHWEGRIVLSVLVRHPLLARFSRPLLFHLSFRFFFFLFCFSLLTLFSPHSFLSSLFSLLTLFSPHAFLPSRFSLFFSPQNVPLARFYISGPSPRGAVRPKLTSPHWRTVTMTTRALPKNVGVGACARFPLSCDPLRTPRLAIRS